MKITKNNLMFVMFLVLSGQIFVSYTQSVEVTLYMMDDKGGEHILYS